MSAFMAKQQEAAQKATDPAQVDLSKLEPGGDLDVTVKDNVAKVSTLLQSWRERADDEKFKLRQLNGPLSVAKTAEKALSKQWQNLEKLQQELRLLLKKIPAESNAASIIAELTEETAPVSRLVDKIGKLEGNEAVWLETLQPITAWLQCLVECQKLEEVCTVNNVAEAKAAVEAAAEAVAKQRTVFKEWEAKIAAVHALLRKEGVSSVNVCVFAG
jgi:hypothetical protein